MSAGTLAAVKANIPRRTYPGNNGNIDEEAEVASAVDTAFGLERDLQLALRQNIEQLEAGIANVGDRDEKTVASGRIDITARDLEGATVVVELKVGVADRNAIGQVLDYKGDLVDRTEAVRGVPIAREFDPRAISAVRAVPNPHLIRLRVSLCI